MQLYKEEVEELKKIVNDVFLVDLDAKNRKRGVVDARKVYSKILRESGHSYESIGNSLSKNHATIIHYVNNIGHIMSYDRSIRDKYVSCKNVFVKKKKSILEQVRKDVDIYVTVIRLENELQEAISSKDKILNDFVDYIEKYEKQRGHSPTIYEYKHTILPLFNK